MMDPIAVLKCLTGKSCDVDYKYRRLYRNLYNPEFYWIAYRNICANKGSMTAGVDGTTVDNMSDERIERIVESMKSGTYRPNPARREYITKKNSDKKRPLGIPSGDDKLVQEVVRMLLESIYEPTFSECSHGFRPGRSCHTALKHIQRTFTGANWFVEGDISKCFDSFDHHVLINLLRRRIEDEKFIILMWKFLKAGYMEQWEYHTTYCGTPQGSGLSPILSSIYLDELDKFMEEYKKSYDVGSPSQRRSNREYHQATYRASRYKREGAKLWDELNKSERMERNRALKVLQREHRAITVRVPKDDAFKAIQYVRYADDFLIGVIGSKEDAQRIKADIKQFLAETLKLEMSDEKTKITHSGSCARFLGYDITVSRDQTEVKKKNGDKYRGYSYKVVLLVPREKWVNKLLEYKAIKIVLNNNGKERFKALHRGKLVNMTDIEILSAYNSEIRGLYNYYSLATNAWKIGVFANLMKYSMLKTFACKYKTSVRKIKARYLRGKDFTVDYQTKSGLKQSVFYNGGFKRKPDTMGAGVSLLPQYHKYSRFNSLRNRVKMGLCELCDKKTDKITLHQVKRMKDLTGKTAWERCMQERRRKTLAVCNECHNEIHQEVISAS